MVKEESKLAEQARIQKINAERLEKQEREEYERLKKKFEGGHDED